MISLKSNVDLGHATPQLAIGLLVIGSVFERHDVPLVLTSVCDGVHHAGSLHGAGFAADLRSSTHYYFPPETDAQLLADGRDALGPAFDFIIEDLGDENLHFHLEWDAYRAGILTRPEPAAPAGSGG